jgi:DNA-binding transcriptional ArsR family regulator
VQWVRIAARVDERVAAELADMMFALSTPSRVQILACLADGPCSVGELVDALGIEQSAVSHQLRVLRDCALVTVQPVGRHRVYALQDDHVVALFEGALRHIEARRRPKKASQSRGATKATG